MEKLFISMIFHDLFGGFMVKHQVFSTENSSSNTTTKFPQET